MSDDHDAAVDRFREQLEGGSDAADEAFEDAPLLNEHGNEPFLSEEQATALIEALVLGHGGELTEEQGKIACDYFTRVLVDMAVLSLCQKKMVVIEWLDKEDGEDMYEIRLRVKRQ